VCISKRDAVLEHADAAAAAALGGHRGERLRVRDVRQGSAVIRLDGRTCLQAAATITT
jgi:hypothetical protein